MKIETILRLSTGELENAVNKFLESIEKTHDVKKTYFETFNEPTIRKYLYIIEYDKK